MKIKNRIITSIISAIITIIIVVMILGGFMFIPSLFLPNPSKPNITYAEFPFTLVYEINGEKKTVEDTLICEYNGVEINTGQGKIRKWRQKFASGNPKILLWVGENVKSLEGFSSSIMARQEIFFYPGPAWYYMGDGEKELNFPGVAFFEQAPGFSGNDGVEGYLFEGEKLFERFGIKIISWECAPPIKNYFK